jgi:hypothetical protein
MGPVIIVPPAYHAQAYSQVDTARFVRALSQVEPFKGRRGLHGERGILQFKEGTWKQFSSLPFSFADNDILASMVGARAIESYKRQLIAQGIDPSVWNLALCWREGVDGAILRRWIPISVKNYAARIVALYLEG